MMRERSQSTRKIMFLSTESLCFGILLAFLVTLGESMNLDVSDGKQSCVIIEAKKGNTINGNFELLTPGSPKNLMVLVLRGGTELLYKKTGLVEDYFRLEAPSDDDYSMCFLNNDKVGEEKWKNVDAKGHNVPLALDDTDADGKKGGDDTDADGKKGGDDTDADGGSYTSMMYSEEYIEFDDLGGWYAANAEFKTIGFGFRVGEEIDWDAMDSNERSTEDKKKAEFLAKEADALLQILKSFNDHESNMRGRENIHRQSLGQISSRLMWYTFIEGTVLLAVSWTQLSYIRRFFETKRTL